MHGNIVARKIFKNLQKIVWARRQPGGQIRSIYHELSLAVSSRQSQEYIKREINNLIGFSVIELGWMDGQTRPGNGTFTHWLLCLTEIMIWRLGGYWTMKYAAGIFIYVFVNFRHSSMNEGPPKLTKKNLVQKYFHLHFKWMIL